MLLLPILVEIFFKINTIIACNINGTSPYGATIAINTAADGSGSSFPIVSTVSIPNDASLIASDKNSALYLEENKSIVVTSSTANTITYTISYEEIS